MKQYVLFDLDGTLIDPWEGITNCVKYALRAMSAPIPHDRILAKFIGPPLLFSFQEYCGFSEEEAERAIGLYRQRFPKKGVYENFLYDGVGELLPLLAGQGRRLLLATSKPKPYAEAILQYHHIGQFFAIVNGPSLLGPHMSKGDVIRDCLRQAGSPGPASCVMIGDRIHDMDGARLAGIDAIAALYGYGAPEEFAYAAALAKTPSQIASAIEALEK